MQMNTESSPQEWDLNEWEKALTIHVGTAYACRECGNLVMVIKGGVGIMDMVCCGRQMEKMDNLQATEGGGKQ